MLALLIIAAVVIFIYAPYIADGYYWVQKKLLNTDFGWNRFLSQFKKWASSIVHAKLKLEIWLTVVYVFVIWLNFYK